MNAMEAQLRETYAECETEYLIELATAGGLTETAEKVLREELLLRKIPTIEIATEEQLQTRISIQNDLQRRDLASLWVRLAAYLIDNLGSLLIISGINLLITANTSKSIADIAGWIGIWLWVGYLFLKDGINGQSVGKRLLNIRVIDRNDGTPCNLPKSFIRGIIGTLGLIDIAFLLGANRQRLADHAANTLVVKTQAPE